MKTEKNVTLCVGRKLFKTTYFSSQTVKTRIQWNNIFKFAKEKNYKLRILYPVKLSFRNEAKRRYSQRKENLPAIKAMLM